MKTANANRFINQLRKIFWITFAWTLISVYQFYVGYTSLLDFNCDLGDNDPSIFFYGSILTGLAAGLIGGSGVVLLWEGWLRNKNYGVALFNIFWSYCLIYIVVDLVTDIYHYSSDLGVSIFALEVWERLATHFFVIDAVGIAIFL